MALTPRQRLMAEAVLWRRGTGAKSVAARARMANASALSFGDKVARGREIAGEALVRHNGRHNDEGDAMRHAEWSRQMADELGSGFSALAGLEHEVEGLVPRIKRAGGDWELGPIRIPKVRVKTDQPVSEAIMDMRNNIEGITSSIQGRPIDRSRLQTSPTRPSHEYDKMRPPYPPR